MVYFQENQDTGIFSFIRIVGLFCVLAVSNDGSATTDVTVTVSGQTVHQTMNGFGTTIRVFDDPHVFDNFNAATERANTTMTTAQQDEILDLLYVDLGLTRVRPATDESMEPVNDNDDPNLVNPDAFSFEWKKNDAFIDLLKRIIPREMTDFFLSPIEIEDWMTESNPEEYVEWAMVVIRRWRDQGLELPYYSIMNEPGYVRGGIWSGEYIRDVIKLLGAQLENEGFATKIVVPDDFSAIEAYQRLQIIMADPIARQYVGAFGYHLYGGSRTDKLNIKAMSLQYDIPVWMTEWSTNPGWTQTAGALLWANTLHDHISEYHVSAVDYMWGFFGEWEPTPTHYISLLYNNAEYTGYRVNRNYYITGQYSRFVTPGFKRVEVTSTSLSVRCTAFTEQSSFAQVCTNNGNVDQTIQTNLNNIDGFSQLQVVRSRFDGSENWADLAAIDVINSSFSTTLPANSTTTFVYNSDTPPSPVAIDLQLDSASISENGGTSQLTISRNGSTTSALLVNLSSNDTSEATLVTSASIQAGTSSVTVSVIAVDDDEVDSDQLVTITASADNTTGANITLLILDDDENEPSDTIAPVITLLGNNPQTLTVAGNYTELGATAMDNVDGDISANIVIESDVNMNLVGNYSVTYNVSDASQNEAIQVTRTVSVTAALASDSADGESGGGVLSWLIALTIGLIGISKARIKSINNK